MFRLFSFRTSSLSRRFAAYVIGFSSILAMILTASELAFEYLHDVKQIDDRMMQVEIGYQDSVAENMWILDKDRLDIQLDSITHLPDFIFAELRIKGVTFMRKGEPLQGTGIVKTFPLKHMHMGQEQTIGELVVAASHESAFQNIIDRALMFLLANTLKTLLVATFILILFYKLIIKHIFHISHYAHQHSTPDSAPALSLERTEPKSPDELSELVNAFNHQRNSLLEHTHREANKAQWLEQEVAKRTAEIMENKQSLLIAKEEAEWASRAKSNFLSSMSHELRTPLNVILGYSQLIELTGNDPEMLSNAKYIHDAGQHLLEMVNNILQITGSESEQLHYEPEAVSLYPLLQDCIRISEVLAYGRHMRFTLEKNIDIPELWVHADKQRLQQAVLKYISNAIKYGRENGIVRISAGRHDNVIRIQVSDDGGGIHTDRQQELFIAFNRLGKENSALLGAGLSLFLVKEMVILMGGRVGVESEIGKGSTFWIELPATHNDGL